MAPALAEVPLRSAGEGTAVVRPCARFGQSDAGISGVGQFAGDRRRFIGGKGGIPERRIAWRRPDNSGQCLVGASSASGFLLRRTCSLECGLLDVIGWMAKAGHIHGSGKSLMFGTIMKKTNCSSPAGSIVYHLSYQDFISFFIVEIQFVAYSYFPGRIY